MPSSRPPFRVVGMEARGARTNGRRRGGGRLIDARIVRRRKGPVKGRSGGALGKVWTRPQPAPPSLIPAEEVCLTYSRFRFQGEGTYGPNTSSPTDFTSSELPPTITWKRPGSTTRFIS